MTFWQRLDRGLNRLYTACGYIGAGFLILLMCFVLGSILTRLFGVYVGGLTEFSGYAMAAASFFALAFTFRDGGHIRVTMLIVNLAPGPRRMMEIFCLAVATVFTIYLAYNMSVQTYFSYIFDERSEGGDAILLWIPQVATSIGSAVLVVAVLHALIKTIAGSTFFAQIEQAGGGHD